MSRILLVILVVLATLGSVSAQKLGHVNFGNLLNEMPATDAADKQLEALQAEMTKKGEAMTAKFNADYANAEKNAPNMAPVDQQKIIQQLEADQLAIRKFEQQISVDLEKRRRILLAPIIKQARAAIEKVAIQQGFDMVIDSSIFNATLFAAEETDLTAMVKNELGL